MKKVELPTGVNSSPFQRDINESWDDPEEGKLLNPLVISEKDNCWPESWVFYTTCREPDCEQWFYPDVESCVRHSLFNRNPQKVIMSFPTEEVWCVMVMSRIINKWINSKIYTACYGCIDNRPSQIEHSCTMEGHNSLVDAYFQDSVNELSMDQLHFVIRKICNKLDLSVIDIQVIEKVYANMKLIKDFVKTDPTQIYMTGFKDFVLDVIQS